MFGFVVLNIFPTFALAFCQTAGCNLPKFAQNLIKEWLRNITNQYTFIDLFPLKIRKAKAQGYTVKLLFFWLPSAEMAIERVKRRVLEGGHNIPEDVIRRRYKAGLKNLFERYIPIVNSWQLLSNADPETELIAKGLGIETEINNKELFDKIKAYAEL